MMRLARGANCGPLGSSGFGELLPTAAQMRSRERARQSQRTQAHARALQHLAAGEEMA